MLLIVELNIGRVVFPTGTNLQQCLYGITSTTIMLTVVLDPAILDNWMYSSWLS